MTDRNVCPTRIKKVPVAQVFLPAVGRRLWRGRQAPLPDFISDLGVYEGWGGAGRWQKAGLTSEWAFVIIGRATGTLDQQILPKN